MKKIIFATILTFFLCTPLPTMARFCCITKSSEMAKCFPPPAQGCAAFGATQAHCETDPTFCDKYISNTCVFAPPGSSSGGTTPTPPPCDSATTTCLTNPGGNICAETNGPKENCSTVTPPIAGYVFLSEIPKTSMDLVPECGAKTETTSPGGTVPTTPAAIPFTAVNPKLMIDIPTLNISDLVATQDANGDINIPYIAVYISALYRYGVAMAAVLAVIMIMVGGFRWLIAAGSAPQISEAKTMITSAVIGLLLALGSYTALQLINPQLTALKSITLKSVTGVPLPLADVGSDIGNFTCADAATLTNISGTSNITAAAGDNRLTSDTNGALGQAGQIAAKTVDPGNPPKEPGSGANFSGLKVVDAIRTQAEQQAKFRDAVAQYGSEEEARKHVATGTTCSGAHLTGHAVDIHLISKGNELTSENMSQARIDALESIMNQAGWVRYCPEWWHFEYNLPLGAKRAKPCDRPYGTGNSAF